MTKRLSRARSETSTSQEGLTPPNGSNFFADACTPLLIDILEVAKQLCDETWRDTRKWFLENHDIGTILSHGDYLDESLVRDMLWLLPQLNSYEQKRYLNYTNSEQAGRNYYCWKCYNGEHDYIPGAKIAKLLKDAPRIYCFVCDKTYEVTFQSCTQTIHKECGSDTEFALNIEGADYCVLCDPQNHVPLRSCEGTVENCNGHVFLKDEEKYYSVGSSICLTCAQSNHNT